MFSMPQTEQEFIDLQLKKLEADDGDETTTETDEEARPAAGQSTQGEESVNGV
jgi:hypothetical protein